MANDETLGESQLSDVFGQNVTEEFQKIEGDNKAFGDAFTLLADKSLETSTNVIKLKKNIDDVSHASDLSKLEDDFGELQEKISAADGSAQDFADKLEDRSFSLGLDIGGDLVDQADAMMESLNDVTEAAANIGEGFLISADNARELAEVFPGILDQATVTADGMIQLNEEQAASAMGVGEADANSFVKAQVDKLNAYASYCDSMYNSYMEQAEAMAVLAEGEATTQEQVDAQKTASEAAATETSKKLLKDKNLTAYDVSQNEAQYAADAGQGIADSTQQGASSAEGSLSQLSQSSAQVANNMINQWHEVGKAIEAGGAGKQGGSNVEGTTAANVAAAQSVTKKDIQAGTEITTEVNGETKTHTVANGEAQANAAREAQEYIAKANAIRRSGSVARAAALALQAKQNETSAARQGAGRGSGGGSGGGGGGSEKAYEPKQKEYIEEEVDLYERVNAQLDKVDATLKGIQQETDRLIGPKARANMNQQLKLLQKEIDLQNEKLRIQQKERDDLKNELNGFGIAYDSEGLITNYADVLKGLEAHVNELIAVHNTTGTQEGQDRLSEEIDGAQENLDKFKDLYKRYDELQGKEIQETINQIEELKNSIEDLRIEAYKASQQALDDIKDIQDS